MAEVRKVQWSVAVDLDRCIGCEACVTACQAENNIRLNTEDIYLQHRAILWMRVERYWEGEFPNVKARYFPVLCQHCRNAPCEPVCPVYAIHHSPDGLNVQTYNRCIGTRYCGNNCPYNIRFFNFWQATWPGNLTYQLNPDVTVRTMGLIEKCTLCIHRIRGAVRRARLEKRDVRDGEFAPACVQACPSDTLIFGDLNDANSRIAQLAKDPRRYLLLEPLGTEPAIFYLKKVDEHAGE